MAAGSKTLDDLRREIDGIDDRLHALILARTALVREVASVKAEPGRAMAVPGAGMRPGREAEVLRRRLAADLGGLPATVFARIWRELIAAFCRLQGPLEVAVCTTEKSIGYWDLARDHFGSATRMSLHHAPGLVIRAVSGGAATVGLLPMPVAEEKDSWWRMLEGTPGSPHVIAKLPFCVNPGRIENCQAMVIGCLPYDGSTDDLSWLSLAADAALSRRSLNDLVRRIGFAGQLIATYEEGGRADYLLETSGFVRRDDSRVVDLAKQLPSSSRVAVIGSYARPLAVG
ncbi:MAG: chorismate mutase [Alphaproteobacteria bacterium]|nr:chorismate mutase [Alphaproteobacteria bacterium]